MSKSSNCPHHRFSPPPGVAVLDSGSESPRIHHRRGADQSPEGPGRGDQADPAEQ